MMMKRVFPFFLVIAIWLPVCFGSIVDDPEIADGYLTDGEYVNIAELEGYEELFIMGGGADRIEARDHGYLEVQDTAKPLGYHSGIYDIMLGDDSELLYLDGITEEITVGGDATAELRGGRIDYITAYHLAPNYLCQVTIYCQEGYQRDTSGISGLWEDGSTFNIQFIDPSSFFDPTWKSINVEIVPEPATLALLGLGTLLMRKRKYQN